MSALPLNLDQGAGDIVNNALRIVNARYYSIETTRMAFVLQKALEIYGESQAPSQASPKTQCQVGCDPAFLLDQPRLSVTLHQHRTTI